MFWYAFCIVLRCDRQSTVAHRGLSLRDKRVSGIVPASFTLPNSVDIDSVGRRDEKFDGGEPVIDDVNGILDTFLFREDQKIDLLSAAEIHGRIVLALEADARCTFHTASVDAEKLSESFRIGTSNERLETVGVAGNVCDGRILRLFQRSDVYLESSETRCRIDVLILAFLTLLCHCGQPFYFYFGVNFVFASAPRGPFLPCPHSTKVEAACQALVSRSHLFLPQGVYCRFSA